MSKLIAALNVFKLAMPLINKAKQWIAPDNVFVPARALIVLAAVLVCGLLVAVMGSDDAAKAVKLAVEIIVPELGVIQNAVP